MIALHAVGPAMAPVIRFSGKVDNEVALGTDASIGLLGVKNQLDTMVLAEHPKLQRSFAARPIDIGFSVRPHWHSNASIVGADNQPLQPTDVQAFSFEVNSTMTTTGKQKLGYVDQPAMELSASRSFSAQARLGVVDYQGNLYLAGNTEGSTPQAPRLKLLSLLTPQHVRSAVDDLTEYLVSVGSLERGQTISGITPQFSLLG